MIHTALKILSPFLFLVPGIAWAQTPQEISEFQTQLKSASLPGFATTNQGMDLYCGVGWQKSEDLTKASSVRAVFSFLVNNSPDYQIHKSSPQGSGDFYEYTRDVVYRIDNKVHGLVAVLPEIDQKKYILIKFDPHSQNYLVQSSVYPGSSKGVSAVDVKESKLEDYHGIQHCVGTENIARKLKSFGCSESETQRIFAWAHYAKQNWENFTPEHRNFIKSSPAPVKSEVAKQNAAVCSGAVDAWGVDSDANGGAQ